MLLLLSLPTNEDLLFCFFVISNCTNVMHPNDVVMAMDAIAGSGG
jgi:hypothetical protein